MEWTVTFLRGRHESATVEVVGVGHDAKPWTAVQRAAWMALKR
jgi:hypothetical protein